MQTTLQPSLYKALQATATLLILRLSAPALCKFLVPAPGFGLAAGPALLRRRARGGTDTDCVPTAQAACVHVTHQCNDGGGCHSLLLVLQPSVGTRFSNRVHPTQRQCPNTQR